MFVCGHEYGMLATVTKIVTSASVSSPSSATSWGLEKVRVSLWVSIRLLCFEVQG